MTEARDVFPELEALDTIQLHAERDRIVRECPDADYKQLGDEALSKLFHINRLLRKRAAPTGAPKSARKKGPATVEDLA